MEPTIHLSTKQARKLALTSQGILHSKYSRGLNGTREAIKHLSYIQIDTISVVERAHHHTLWNRVPHYRHRYLARLVDERTIFEYWAHAAAYLPIEDFRFCLPRMHAIKQGQRHWYKRNTKLMRLVLDRIASDGPLQAKDFEQHKGSNGGMWEWGPVKQAIEHLFMQGDLLVTRRDNFQKVFDLTERVIPSNINTRVPTKVEYAHYLIDRYLNAHGIAQLSEFSYLRKGMGPSIKLALSEKVESKQLHQAKIGKQSDSYFIRTDFERVLTRRLSTSKAKILSPFDNLVIQRKRINRLFGFEYQLECYVPKEKRKQGYFMLPILWKGDLVARMDAKADRKNCVLIIYNIVAESKLKQKDYFIRALLKAVKDFAIFNGCSRFKVSEQANEFTNIIVNR